MPAIIAVIAACWAVRFASRATSRRRMFDQLHHILRDAQKG